MCEPEQIEVKNPRTLGRQISIKDKAFEDVVTSAQDEAVLVLVY